MILDRFGDTYATAYQFGQLDAEDNLETERPEVLQPVGGASGAFDFWGDEGYPIAPFRISKSFRISASTYAGLETALTSLRLNTVGAGRSKLWALMRDGNTLWTWAKATRVTYGERKGHYTDLPVEVDFVASDGIWYDEERGQLSTLVGTGFTTTVENGGNYKSLLSVTITATGGAITSLTLTNNTNGMSWTFSGTIASGTDLVVDALSRICTNDGTDAYADLTLGSDQLEWMYLDPGNNQLELTFTGVTCDFELSLVDAYI